MDQLAASFGIDLARRVLRATAQAILRASRGSDACMRIGPTRFGVVLVETDEIAAINFVERVRDDAPRRLPAGADGLRFGFGWASPEPAEAPGALVRRAETRLMVELLGDEPGRSHDMTEGKTHAGQAHGIPEPSGWEDTLTGLEGPDFWQRVLVAEVARAVRYKRSLTVVVAEVDGVETMAETWGWNVGRHAIREAAQCLRRTSRTSDYCTRIGLARFGVILTETDEIAAINFVERVREAGPRTMPRAGDGCASTSAGRAPARASRPTRSCGAPRSASSPSPRSSRPTCAPSGARSTPRGFVPTAACPSWPSGRRAAPAPTARSARRSSGTARSPSSSSGG